MKIVFGFTCMNFHIQNLPARFVSLISIFQGLLPRPGTRAAKRGEPIPCPEAQSSGSFNQTDIPHSAAPRASESLVLVVWLIVASRVGIERLASVGWRSHSMSAKRHAGSGVASATTSASAHCAKGRSASTRTTITVQSLIWRRHAHTPRRKPIVRLRQVPARPTVVAVCRQLRHCRSDCDRVVVDRQRLSQKAGGNIGVFEGDECKRSERCGDENIHNLHSRKTLEHENWPKVEKYSRSKSPVIASVIRPTWTLRNTSWRSPSSFERGILTSHERPSMLWRNSAKQRACDW
uniref:Uncharacterized protein n=1 Tax=Schistocephalus solidus TaxID=70667 RepID=A0A0X3PK46_SCHSO